jgi:hypothetical protein
MKLEKRNAYYCKACKRVTITVDVNEGVTPMFILCPHCNCSATSFMYQLPGALHLGVEADYEWYKPDAKETLMLSKAEAEHVFKGGLLMRKRTKAQPIYKELTR